LEFRRVLFRSNFTLRSNLSIRKLALFVLDEKWNCKVNFGTTTNFFGVDLPDYFKTLNGISSLKPNENSEFAEFDIVIPVAHKRNNLAIAFVGGIYQDESRFESEDALRFIQALSNIIIVAIENKKLARTQLEQEALRQELEIASDVQQFLFPERLPYTDMLKLEASYLPHDRIGGDYYDFVPINKDQFLICVA